MVNNITILRPFTAKPRERLHLAEISRETAIPHPTARQWLNKFVAEGVLKKKIQGRLTFYYLNYDFPYLIDYLVITEKDKMIGKCNQSLINREVVNYFYENYQYNNKIIIFGSAAESKKEPEDIDILIAGKIDKSKINKLSERINKNIHAINVSNLSKVSAALKNEIVKKHLIVQGSEDIIRWMLW